MSNPIVDNVEYLIEQEDRRQGLKKSNSNELHPSDARDLNNGDGTTDNDSDDGDDSSSSSGQQHNEAAVNRWYSMIRRISINIQRESGTPDQDIRVGTPAEPTEQERNLMLNVPIVASGDDNLPSIEEMAKENARMAVLHEMKRSYFEKPFDSDGTPSLTEAHNQQEVASLNGREARDNKIFPDQAMISTPSSIAHDDARVQNQDASGSQRARANWGRSLDKIRIVNSLSLPKRRSSMAAPPAKFSLAPYYSTAFVPPYFAMWPRDEHGRKPPPILFDVLSVSITDSEIDPNSVHRLWTFRIELQYGEIRWVINRTIIEFYNLHLTLKFKAGISGHGDQPPSFPSQLAHLCNAALSSMRITREEDMRDDSFRDISLKRRNALEQYLRDLIKDPSMVTNYDLCEFLEISAISIVKDMGWKGREGYLEHMMNPASPSLFRVLRFNRRWAKEWVILRDSYIALCKNIGSTTPSDVLLFDRHFKVKRKQSAFAPYHQTHIIISNGTRRIEIKGSTTRQIEDWMESFRTVQRESPWVRNHRFGSYAPIRENANVKWFVDGHEYFEAVAESILSAKSDIYIEDWWLSPELYLKRPPKGNEEFRIDRLLKRKACEGVMIYIVIYKNMSVALPLDSQHTRDWLQGIHPNIVVQRHSDITSPLWAHHEKIVVVDNRLAFIGGLDLCFGRYDTPEHDLTDFSADDEDCLQVFPGQDYSNPRIKDFIKVSQYDRELIDKRSAPRMPWHDIHTVMVGQPARDVARHFIQRWNFIKSTTRGKDRQEVPFLLPKGEYVNSRDEEKFQGTCRVQVVRSSSQWSQGIPEREYSIYNAYMECITKAKHFIYIENQFFITATHPEDKLIKNKIGQAIVERIRRAHRERKPFRIIVVIPCAPGFEGDFASADRRSMPLRSVAQYQYMSISRGGHSILEELQHDNIPAEDYIGFYSLRNWGRVKAKILTPMVSSIGEEMPVISPTSTQHSTDLDRSNSGRQKRWSGAKARTSIGSFGTSRGNSNQSNNDETLSRSRSLGSQEQRPEMNDSRMECVTEQVYIHSKLMIVDDKTVICGSANLNDRSQLGNRDSEIAIVVEDTDMVDSRMNGEPYKAARFALTLRMQLFKEHLGLLKGEKRKSGKRKTLSQEDALVMDPLHEEFYTHVWDKTAKKNTSIFRSLFRCVPDDSVFTFDQHRRFVPDPTVVAPGHIAMPSRLTPDEVRDKLAEIRGHLVIFPTQYLCAENMTASIVQEAVPVTVFT